MTENELIEKASEMGIIQICKDNAAKYYMTKKYRRTCPICGKVFNATASWAYRKDGKWYCRYTHYVQAEGDEVMKMADTINSLAAENAELRVNTMILEKIIKQCSDPADKEKIIKLTLENAALREKLEAAEGAEQ